MIITDIAVVRKGAVYQLFINGVVKQVYYNSPTTAAPAADWYIGIVVSNCDHELILYSGKDNCNAFSNSTTKPILLTIDEFRLYTGFVAPASLYSKPCGKYI